MREWLYTNSDAGLGLTNHAIQTVARSPPSHAEIWQAGVMQPEGILTSFSLQAELYPTGINKLSHSVYPGEKVAGNPFTSTGTSNPVQPWYKILLHGCWRWALAYHLTNMLEHAMWNSFDVCVYTWQLGWRSADICSFMCVNSSAPIAKGYPEARARFYHGSTEIRSPPFETQGSANEKRSSLTPVFSQRNTVKSLKFDPGKWINSCT